ncbi:tetratricopeptide repeat protein [Kitasatospora sp. A2-31]|uniref:tetratricopeptide repeat protein n=1 Tax=Kitasatospora sp. A2-31 TaxID=2916414 RepID=UPI001EEF3910|nr:tetratricopeptide repeat protein [Kitasatospora sp. A2-31]MCG6499329.1 tetratricopeptide repeat protein [Kitasatospora sp. A2-31]
MTIRTTVLPASAVRDAADTEARGVVSLRARKHTFTGRTAELTEVRAELARSTGTSAVVLHGLGGVGKTELALQYAHLHSESYDLIWWIESAVPGATEAALAAIAEQLSPHWTGTEPSLSARAAWARTWLQQHDRWLLIHNNVEEPALLEELLGSLPRGHHLITSRNATGWQHRQVRFVGLNVLPRNDSVALIGSWVPFASPQEEWHAGQLARELGDLPLALEQAGAYMNQTMTSIEEYRSSLHEILDEAALDHAGDEQTIAGVWTLTLTALAESNPLSVELLHTLAWLAPDGFPRGLLAGLTTSPVRATTALGLLRAYNMVTLSLEEVTVHRLVQKVLRDRATREAAARATADGPPPAPRGREAAERILLAAVYPNGPEENPDTVQLARLAAHATALSTTDPGTYRPGPAQLFDDTAQHLRRQGQTIRALPVLRAYSRQVVAGFGPDHPTALIGCNAFASALAAAGELGGAIEALKELRERSIRALGPGVLPTLNIRANLASAYHDSGRFDSAIEEYIDVTAVAAEHLGPTHTQTLALRNGLALAYQDSGRVKQAIDIYEDLLRDDGLLVRGDDDATLPAPNVARVRNNLAGAYESLGRYEESIAHYRKAHNELTAFLGAGHPTTVDCLCNLAYALESAGRLDEASAIYHDVLEQRVATLGEDHPDTLLSQSNLANLYLTNGQVEAGLQLCHRTLVQREQILGRTHVDTLLSRNMLASAHESAGDLERAAELFEETLGQREKVLGSGHPATLRTLANLAFCRLRLGDAAAAVPMFEKALIGQQRLSGLDHPDALNHLHNLAAACREAGDLDRARDLFTTALDRRTQVLGEHHFETLTTLSGLARLHQADGHLDRAIPLYEAAIAGLTKALGPDHPTTRAVSGYLAEARTP